MKASSGSRLDVDEFVNIIYLQISPLKCDHHNEIWARIARSESLTFLGQEKVNS